MNVEGIDLPPDPGKLEVGSVPPPQGVDLEKTGANKDDIRHALGLEKEKGTKNEPDKATKPEGTPEKNKESKKGVEQGNEEGDKPPLQNASDDEDLPLDLIEEAEEGGEENKAGGDLSSEQLEEIESSIKDEKVHKAFQSMRQQLVAAKKEKASGVEGGDDLKKQLEETQKKLAAFSLAEDPAFKEKYVVPIQERFQQVAKVFTDFGLEAELAKEAFDLTNASERISFLNDNIPSAAAVVNTMLSDMDMMNGKRLKALQNFSETRKAIEASSSEEFSAALKSSIDSVVEKFREEGGHFLLKESKSSDKWNAAVKARLEKARRLAVKNPSVEQISELSIRAAMADDYRDMYLKLNDQYQKLMEQTGRQRKASPRLGSGASHSPGNDKAGKPKTSQEVADAMTNRLLSKMS